MKALSHLQKRRFSALRGAAALFLAASAVVASMTAFDVPVDAADASVPFVPHTAFYASPAVQTVHVKINGIAPSFAYAPFLSGDYTYIPLRAVMEHLGATVEWIESIQSIVITSAGKTITMTIDSDEMTVNGVKKTLPVKVLLVGDVTYVPLRAVSESLGAAVGWDDSTQTVGIYTNEKTHSLSLGISKVAIGQTFDSFTALHGLPTYSVSGENGLMWHVYANPAAFLTVASDGGIVCAY